MIPHAIIAYTKYLWRAKKLHGVHSPFAYSFSENVLYAANPMVADIQLPTGTFDNKYATLPGIIKQVYNYNPPLLISATSKDVAGKHNMAIITEKNPGNWVQLFNKFLPCLDSDSVLILPKIHATKRHTLKWKRLCAHPKVMLSIDVFGAGIIFFKKEFKEKQHFVLKY